VGPFTEDSEGGASTGHVKGGTGWYRKHFFTRRTDRLKRISILFDGVYMDASVWINGTLLGNHPYGYTAFWFDLTPYLNPPGKENVIAVQVRNLGKNSRWYSGSGIYRNVWLVKKGTFFIRQWASFVTTSFVSEDSAIVNITTSIGNESGDRAAIMATAILVDPDGKKAGKVVIKTDSYPGESAKLHFKMPVRKPKQWSTDAPGLYTAVIRLEQDGKPVDQDIISFGIRKTEFSAAKGFLLNGKSVLLKGGCMHHDNGALGSAAFRAAEFRRVRIMKENGFNAVRTSHNPPSQEFLDACDQLGILVIDEAFDQWQRPKNEMDYSRFFDRWWEKDIESMVMRDRNHPSVIIWSIGNEINERADSSGIEIARKLKNKIKELDPTRPVTQAICHFWDHKGRGWEDTAPAFAQMDVHGYNYQWQEYEPDHEKYPDRIIIGTESFPMEAFENWQMVEKHPWVIGDFVWTGWDYLGESGIGHTKFEGSDWGFLPPWPWFNAYCGDISILGYKKPQMYFRDVVWGNSQLEILVHEPVPAGKKELISKWGWPAEWKSWN
jgi:beta-galactosidase